MGRRMEQLQPQGKQAPASSSSTPCRGALQESKRASAFMKEHPLSSRFLAVADWGQSPWKIQHIVSEAVLCFERNSSDPEKRKIAADVYATINLRIEAAKELYSSILSENGEKSEIAAKLRNDISFMENMRNVIDAQVNGLISRQNSWKKRAEDVQKRYDELIRMKSWWDNVRSRFPWVYIPVGVAAGAVASWFTDGWNAATSLTQYLFHLAHGSKLILDSMKAIVDFAFGAASAAAGALAASKAAKSAWAQSLCDALAKPKEEIKKRLPAIGGFAGAAAGLLVFASGALDGAISFFREVAQKLHTDPQIDKFIDPIVKLGWNLGGMFFFGWFLQKMDQKAFARKERLLNECEAKQLEIVNEEKVFRRKIIAIIKQKAIELHAKYGYFAELDKEDVEALRLAEAGDWQALNALHKERMRRIFKDENIPDEYLAGAEADSRSTDLVVQSPQSKPSPQQQSQKEKDDG
ncbi:MAG: hypothetical protein N3F07_01485 [Candidatus Micrarchaeota archaeon]|nr:hypothetical protein [Candidatus Micrarchaeota archaeon]